MPCTAAEAPCTVVTQGMFIATAAERISYPSIRGPELPYGVLITMSTSPARIASTAEAAGLPSPGGSKCLRTSSHGMPLRRNISAVPSVASTRKPRSASRFTGKTRDRLSRLATDTNTVPSAGSEP